MVAQVTAIRYKAHNNGSRIALSGSMHRESGDWRFDPSCGYKSKHIQMETSVSVYKNGDRFLADIHIDGVDVSNLHKFDNGYILSMVRPQVMSILQFGDDITDLGRLADYTSAIVDGIPLPE